MIAGANVANEIVEREPDGLMKRTAIRPLPANRMETPEAIVAMVLMTILGFFILLLGVNSAAAGLALLSFALYVFAYTPLKRVGPWCVLVGAIPGAIPAMIGPVAVNQSITPLAWLLFGIVFFWQFPHFCAIAWVAKDEYKRAGFKVLSSPENPRLLAYQVIVFSLLLFAVSPGLTILGKTGLLYYGASMILGFLLLAFGLIFWFRPTQYFAKRLMGAALVYLPSLFLFMILDRVMLPW